MGNTLIVYNDAIYINKRQMYQRKNMSSILDVTNNVAAQFQAGDCSYVNGDTKHQDIIRLSYVLYLGLAQIIL